MKRETVALFLTELITNSIKEKKDYCIFRFYSEDLGSVSDCLIDFETSYYKHPWDDNDLEPNWEVSINLRGWQIKEKEEETNVPSI